MRHLRTAILVLLAALTAAYAQTQARRQPAPVMSAAGADWLTRPERIQEEDPDRMLASLDIKKGAVVAASVLASAITSGASRTLSARKERSSARISRTG